MLHPRVITLISGLLPCCVVRFSRDCREHIVMHTIMDRTATTQHLFLFGSSPICENHRLATVSAWSVHIVAMWLLFVCHVLGFFRSSAEETMYLPTAREAHREWIRCRSSFVRVCFRARHSRQAIERTNDEKIYHSDALQRVMCAKSSL